MIGGNAEGVTGSCTKIECYGQTLLFELGMIQDNHTILENYRANSRMISKIKSKEIDMVIIGHVHTDHIGSLPTLFARGNDHARIIVPRGSTRILKEMLLDCAYINQRDCETLNLKSKSSDGKYTPLYTEDQVYQVLAHIEEIEIGKIVQLNDHVSIRYTPSGHILCSCQTELYINGGSHTRKILFTSDLGNSMILPASVSPPAYPTNKMVSSSRGRMLCVHLMLRPAVNIPDELRITLALGSETAALLSSGEIMRCIFFHCIISSNLTFASPSRISP